VDRVVGLEGVRMDVARLETLDGHGRLELMTFHAPTARGGDRHALANTLGIGVSHLQSMTSTPPSPGCKPGARSSLVGWNATKTVTGSATSAVRRGASSCLRSRSAEGSGRPLTASPASVVSGRRIPPADSDFVRPGSHPVCQWPPFPRCRCGTLMSSAPSSRRVLHMHRK
jgi:hypothetical protein